MSARRGAWMVFEEGIGILSVDCLLGVAGLIKFLNVVVLSSN